MDYKLIKLDYKGAIGYITFNRPEKLNAFTQEFFSELAKAVEEMDKNDNIGVVIIKAEGDSFSAGLDFHDFLQNIEQHRNDKKSDEDFLKNNVMFMQNSISRIEQSKKIYIAAIHGYCVGGGLDLASTCDIRVASENAVFSIMETKLGVVADLGSLQRLPKIIGEGSVKLLAYTSMKIDAKTALSMGLVSRIYKNKEETIKGAENIAEKIIFNPIKAVFATKEALNYGNSHSVEESLEFAARYNAELFDFDEVKGRFLKNIKKVEK